MFPFTYPFSHDKSCCTAILKVFESVRALITFFSCFALSTNALVFFTAPLLAMIFLVNCGKCSPPTGLCPQLNGSLCGANICIVTGPEPRSQPGFKHNAPFIIQYAHTSILGLKRRCHWSKSCSRETNSCLFQLPRCSVFLYRLFGLATGSCSRQCLSQTFTSVFKVRTHVILAPHLSGCLLCFLLSQSQWIWMEFPNKREGKGKWCTLLWWKAWVDYSVVN